jgi:threonylcarbamoyladenosine tRNA methylthiotransferase MtaB
MKKIGILTLGCRVNQYESDALKESLEALGHEVGELRRGCDLYIINTCTVTAESDAKCRKAIRRAARLKEESGGALAVIGCFSQGSPDSEVLKLADYVIGNGRKMSVVEKLDAILKGEEKGAVESLAGAPFEKMSISRCSHAKAYVKIEDGCNNFCTYCFVPYVRGRVRSRDRADILCEIKALENNGYTEIILTGIETASYGEDKNEKDALCKLIEEISENTSIKRLRLGSMYPSFFTPEHCKRLASCRCVMPHFHLSVQSGADAVLKGMKRGYTRQELYEAVENIRREFPDAALSCDMICGFPDESEQDFCDSVDFIKDAEILHAHIFPYSKRQGTRAASFEGQIPENIKHERAAVMKKEAEAVSSIALEKYIGKQTSVLVEKCRGTTAYGYTEHFVYSRCEVNDEVSVGDIITFTLEKENILLLEDTENSQKGKK